MISVDLRPVFWCEWRRLSRQRWLYLARSVYVAGLLAGLIAVWWAASTRVDLNHPTGIARAGEWYFTIITLGQISMVLLAAPASTAGAFSSDMTRGHVFMTL